MAPGRAVLLAAVALALLPGAAAAKEIKSVTVCGKDRCHVITDQAALLAIMRGGYDAGLPTHRSDFLLVRARFDERSYGLVGQYLPDQRLIRYVEDDHSITYQLLSFEAAGLLDRAGRGLVRFPALLMGHFGHGLDAQVFKPPAPERPGDRASPAWPWLLLALLPAAAALHSRNRLTRWRRNRVRAFP